MLKYSKRKIEDILNFYNLNDAITYYRLYNKSKYINSYHGYMHVLNFLNSLFEICKEYNIDHGMTKTLLLASIFHDFNYQGVDSFSKGYDRKNIESSVDAWDSYASLKSFSFEYQELVEKIIRCSLYPEYDKPLDISNQINSIFGNKSKSAEFFDKPRMSEFYFSIFRDADHSMPLYANYEFLCWQFLTHECQGKSKEDYFRGADNYLDRLKFDHNFFQKIWEESKEDVISSIMQMLENAEMHANFGKDWNDTMESYLDRIENKQEIDKTIIYLD